MLKIHGLGHINIVVDNIEKAMTYYENLLGATPQQLFPHFRNVGFSKSAGFMDKPEAVEVSIGFLHVRGANFFIELMEYHYPKGDQTIHYRKTNDVGGPRHVCLQVTDIDDAFNFIKTQEVKLISDHPDYKPYKISAITPDEFKFYDEQKENSVREKQAVCDIIGGIRYFYFIDQYGIQWECEEGHSDIGDKPEETGN
ncbi:MAG: bleomycin resistance protein [Gammaproteobacteria bacterium CG11_big_fil_rev_8_21_14_0_20_46_22]|nr:MAG: bleomycin resistance protein [Gammaproteobacteria bacterium CG12_big_fil_rev_8_21_14_0_65_46_12]PIR12191.1 MAG: bleomycin resistance protein [Gammaproteobacteria bacterium CG11_big_fil_rev_8_21_14_0_20_46_22]